MFDRLLQNNTIVKVIASVLAILLWFVVHSGQEAGTQGTAFTPNTQQLRDKPVQVWYDENIYSLVGEPKVTLTLRGNSFDVLNAISYGDSIKAIADATPLKEGTHQVVVRVEGIPAGVTVEPATVTIRLEAIQNKEVPITLQTEGNAKEGMAVGEALVTPKTVIISGPKTEVDLVAKVVASVTLDNAEETIRTSAPLAALDQAGNPVKNVYLSRDRAEVNIPITKPSKSVPVRLQFKGDLPSGLAVESVTQTNSVTIYGTSNVLASVDSYTAPVIDLTGITKSTTMKLKLALLPGVTEIQPAEIDVDIRVVPSQKRTFDNIPVKVTGLKDTESYELVSPTDQVKITVEGAKSLLDKLAPGDITATIDVSNQPVGLNEMLVQVHTPPFIKGVATEPATLTVNVKK
jgi:YbbR domain-containing protein